MPKTQDWLPSRRYAWGVIGLAVLYVIIAGSYAWRLPVLGGPDEEAHWRYVRVLRAQWRLPLLPRLAQPGDEACSAEQAQHPPLYYALLAAVTWIWPELNDTTVPHGLKLLSVLMGLGTILALARLTRRVWPENDTLALGAVGLVALLPNVAYMTALLNNTVGSLLGSTLGLLALERAVARPGLQWRLWFLVGLVIGLAMLAKVTAAWLVPAAAVALALKLYSEKKLRWCAFAPTAALVLPILLLIGAWLVRNVLTCGELMPERVLDRRYAPLGTLVMLFDAEARTQLLWVITVSIPLSMATPWWVLRTFWWQSIAMASLGLLMLPALTGGICAWHRIRGHLLYSLTPRKIVLLACLVGGLAAWFIALQAVLHDWNTGLYPGRYALEAAPALGLLWAAGMGHFCRRPLIRVWTIGLGLVFMFLANILVYQALMRFFNGSS